VWCGEEGVGGSGKDQQARLLAWRVALRRGLESTGRNGESRIAPIRRGKEKQAGKVRLGIINSLTFVFLSND
jgi:hypothetical protein